MMLIKRFTTRTALNLAVGALALAAVGFADAGQAARADGAWCAEQGGRGGYSNCGYATFAQCRAAVSGVGGTCRPHGGALEGIAGPVIFIYRP
jgi:hypothetical protein